MGQTPPKSIQIFATKVNTNIVMSVKKVGAEIETENGNHFGSKYVHSVFPVEKAIVLCQPYFHVPFDTIEYPRVFFIKKNFLLMIC